LAWLKSRSTRRLLALLIVAALSIAAIFSTQLFETAADNLALQDSDAAGVSVGRYDLAVMLWNQMKAAQTANWIFGFGPGAADSWVTSYFILGNPHNDWLKILFDYGIFGFFCLHAIWFLTLTRHRLGIMIYLYSATLMMTDNVFIYMFHQVFVAMMMCTGRPEGEYLASTRGHWVPPTN
jgi:O-antigen ligase